MGAVCAMKVRRAAHKAEGTGLYSAEAKAKRNKAEKVRDAAHKAEGTGRWSPEAKAKRSKAQSTPEAKARRNALALARKLKSMPNFIRATHHSMKSSHKRNFKGVCMDFDEAWADFLEQCPQNSEGRYTCTHGIWKGEPFDLSNKIDWPSPDRKNRSLGYIKGECHRLPPLRPPLPQHPAHTRQPVAAAAGRGGSRSRR